MYLRRPVQLIMLKVYLGIISMVYKVSGRYGKGIRNQQIRNGGISVIFQSGDIPVSSDVTATPQLAYYIIKIVLHISEGYQTILQSEMLRD
jgi:hypothetical protein